jgi:hypothetical protein
VQKVNNFRRINIFWFRMEFTCFRRRPFHRLRHDFYEDTKYCIACTWTFFVYKYVLSLINTTSLTSGLTTNLTVCKTAFYITILIDLYSFYVWRHVFLHTRNMKNVSILKTEAMCSSETSVIQFTSSWYQCLKVRSTNTNPRKNLKSILRNVATTEIVSNLGDFWIHLFHWTSV